MEEWMIGAAVAVSGYALNYGYKVFNVLHIWMKVLEPEFSKFSKSEHSEMCFMATSGSNFTGPNGEK